MRPLLRSLSLPRLALVAIVALPLACGSGSADDESAAGCESGDCTGDAGAGGTPAGAAGKGGAAGSAKGGAGGKAGAGAAGGKGGASGQAGASGKAGASGGGGAASGAGGSAAGGASGGGQAGAGLGGSGGAGGSAGPAGQGGSSGNQAGGQAGQVGQAGTSAGPTCKQAGGDRCGAQASECAGLTQLASTDCAVCCIVPKNPVYGKSFPDPFIVRVGDTYHGFSTNASGKVIPHITSKDLDKWTLDQDSSLDPGPWADQTTDLWAPTVYQNKNGTWVMYYAGQVKGSGQHCLGRATSSGIGAKFVDKSSTPFICKGSGHWSLDPSVFTDQSSDKDYLVWRQDTSAQPHGTVHISQLDATGHLTGAEKELIARATSEPSWEFDSAGGVMENPAMIRAGGTYHLFYSGNRWETAKYANGHAVCDTPMGPCTKTSKQNPWQGSLGKMLGPGGADFVKAQDGTVFMYMHGWESPDVGPGVGTRKLWFYRFEAPKGQTPSIAPL